MNRVVAPLIMLVVLLVLIASGTFYTVNETEQVIVTQFGEPARAPITTPGLKVKVPFMQTVHRFDKRILEWDGLPGQIPTLDKRFIVMDTSARWRIVDPLLSAYTSVYEYDCGSWGPEADRIVAPEGGWHNPRPGNYK